MTSEAKAAAVIGWLKNSRPTGPWGMAARHPRTGDHQEAFWALWNPKSMTRWIKLYEGLGYEILLPVPGTTIHPPARDRA